MTLRAIHATAPSHWASYLINGDPSGLTDADRSDCDLWAASMGGSPVSCEDAGFIKHHDARTFAWYAADCQTYTFLRER